MSNKVFRSMQEMEADFEAVQENDCYSTTSASQNVDEGEESTVTDKDRIWMGVVSPKGDSTVPFEV